MISYSCSCIHLIQCTLCALYWKVKDVADAIVIMQCLFFKLGLAVCFLLPALHNCDCSSAGLSIRQPPLLSLSDLCDSSQWGQLSINIKSLWMIMVESAVITRSFHCRVWFKSFQWNLRSSIQQSVLFVNSVTNYINVKCLIELIRSLA